MKHRKSAPAFVVNAYENSRIGLGRPHLRRLLDDPNMDAAWTTLSKYVKHDREWQRLWAEVVWALRVSSKDEMQRRDRRDAFKVIAKRAASLRKELTRVRWDQLLAFAFLSAADVEAWVPHKTGWDSTDDLTKHTVAQQAFAYWPAIDEILRGMEGRADSAAAMAMTEPRLLDRQHGKQATKRTRFVRQLDVGMRELKLRRQSDPAAIRDKWLSRAEVILVIAKIAAGIMNDPEISESLVRKSLNSRDRPRTRK